MIVRFLCFRWLMIKKIKQSTRCKKLIDKLGVIVRDALAIKDKGEFQEKYIYNNFVRACLKLSQASDILESIKSWYQLKERKNEKGLDDKDLKKLSSLSKKLYGNLSFYKDEYGLEDLFNISYDKIREIARNTDDLQLLRRIKSLKSPGKERAKISEKLKRKNRNRKRERKNMNLQYYYNKNCADMGNGLLL